MHSPEAIKFRASGIAIELSAVDPQWVWNLWFIAEEMTRDMDDASLSFS